MNKLAKTPDSTQWGEDPHLSLSVARRTGSDALARQATEAIQRQYRLRIRLEFEKNAEVISLLARSEPALSALQALSALLQPLCREESSDIFQDIIIEILTELDELRKKPGSMYLVDTDTGKAGMAISPQHIYHPPSFLGEDGKMHKAQPILHPGIAAPLIQDRFEKGRVAQALAKASPTSSAALEHLRDPEGIRSRALEILTTYGISTQEVPTPARQVVLEFGKEHVDGSLQSLNPRFHRAHMFGDILTRRVLAELGEQKMCFVGPVQQKKNSKKCWYEVVLQIPLSRESATA